MPPSTPDLNDPEAVLEFSVGPLEGAAALQEQKKGSLPELHNLYHSKPHTFVAKRAFMETDDWRCFDVRTGKRVYNSHHPGKNPYEMLDPLGLQNTPPEWESLCDVSGHDGGFKIRPKKMSMHGRQYVKVGDRIVMSVAKKSKLKTMSLLKVFSVSEGEEGPEVATATIDLAARCIQFRRADDDALIAVATKPMKTLFLNTVFGVGSELRIDVAPGVDCSFILAAFLGLKQCGAHLLKDIFSNFVMDPLKDEALETAIGMGAELATSEEARLDVIEKVSHAVEKVTHAVEKVTHAVEKAVELVSGEQE